jgi:hypothetical protein
MRLYVAAIIGAWLQFATEHAYPRPILSPQLHSFTRARGCFKAGPRRLVMRASL